jgi:LPXTG-site transpeptidase (sortase) family protein
MAAAQHVRVGRVLYNLLFALGVLFLLVALTYGAYSMLNTWLMGQNRYLVSHDIALISVPAMTWTPSPTATPTLPPTFTAPPTPIPSPTQTGGWTWNIKTLFRSGRSDLVGHWQGTSNPGESGNMILVGHNYGYGYNGVFVRLGSLKAGHKVYIVNQAGKTFTYQVTTVRRIKWRLKNFAELTQHLGMLSPGGAERLTLVSCAGANIEPFPERVYVVAVPVK